jgi:FMN phosphatase YigB (HAD superfamily)
MSAGAAMTPLDWAACKRLIDDADVVSFDFFDTLVTRLAATPDAVQHYVGSRLEAKDWTLSGFFARRKAAENQARALRSPLGDVDMDMIYTEFNLVQPWCNGAGRLAQALEIDIDQAFIVPRGEVIDLLRYAKAAGKRTLIISDSYFPVSFLESALAKLGWTGLIDKIYLSSAEFARKDTGALWDVVVEQESLDRLPMIHFGDNSHSDIVSAQAKGVLAALLPNPVRLAADRGLDHVAGEDWRADLLLGPLFARLGADPFSSPRRKIENGREFGYLVYGPIFLAFFAWLIGDPALRGMHRLYFAGREGYFLQQLFDRLASEFSFDDLPPTVYLPISRRAVIMASQAESFDPKRVLETGSFSGPVETFLDARLGLDLEPVDLFALSVRVPEDSDYLERILHILEPLLVPRAKHERDAMLAYGRQTGLLGDGPLGLVDIGYSGTIQAGLQEVLRRPFTGFYMATSERVSVVTKAGGLAFGCFQDVLRGEVANDDFMPKTVLIEALLTAPHGQLSHFRLDASGTAVPVHNPGGKSQAHFSDLIPIFEGGLDYCRDMIRVMGRDGIGDLLPARLAALRGLDAVLSGRIAIGDRLKDTLYLEDWFCGNGEIPGLRPR